MSPEAEANGIGAFNETKVQETIKATTAVFNLNRTVSPDEVYTAEYLPGKITLSSNDFVFTPMNIMALLPIFTKQS